MKRAASVKSRQVKRPARRAKAKATRLSPLGKRIISALAEVRDDVSGRKALPRRAIAVPEKVDVRAIREKLGMSQAEFAEAYSFSIATVRNWEQHRREPDSAARVLLAVIERAPEAVRQALEDSGSKE